MVTHFDGVQVLTSFVLKPPAILIASLKHPSRLKNPMGFD